MNNNEMELKFTAISENESFARGVIGAFIILLDPSVDEYSEIKTVVSEVVTNAIIHGYESDASGFIYMKAKIDLLNKKLILEVRDEGCGIINLAEAREPLYTSKPELERSGMGFTIMENFSDYVEVESTVGRGTTVKITKYFEKNSETTH